MATADDDLGSAQRGRDRLPRWLVPLAFVVVLAGALAAGLGVTGDEATAPASGATTALPAVEVQADSIYRFTTLGEMADASDVIVVGTVTATESGRLVGDPAGGGVISRLVTIEVDETVRGEVGATVVVEEEGTLPDGTPLIVNGVPGSTVGDHGIWFLDRLDDAELPVFLVINSQGKFLTSADPAGPVVGGDERDPLVQQLRQLTLDELVDACRAALRDG